MKMMAMVQTILGESFIMKMVGMVHAIMVVNEYKADRRAEKIGKELQ
jgi:hypothetical protein